MKTNSAVSGELPRNRETAHDRFAEDVLSGLSLPQKSLPCKYIYDDFGTELFSRIMTLPEYYPARCETEILESHGASIAEKAGPGPLNLVELGAGDGSKTRILVKSLIDAGTSFTYVPIDISRAAVSRCEEHMCRDLPDLKISGMVSDYFEGLKWLSGQNHAGNAALFLGSTIGNFPPNARRNFLDKLRRSLNPGDMVLIGVDLVKDTDVMVRAYNDTRGVTEQFNKNILARINRELGGTFDLDGFRYFSDWDAASGGIQSFLVSRRMQSVGIEALSKTFVFKPGESIHTESSYKFTLAQIKKMAAHSGFSVSGCYMDSKSWFADFLFIANPVCF
ncbi:MAG: L-histidine N(alpha)-methyltransferase [Desulfosalsimonas sp.]